MTRPDAPDWWPVARPAFVPRGGGFGARLLGLDPAAAATDPEALIRAARQERELLRPDLLVVGAGVTELLPAGGEELGRESWAMFELGDPGPALAAVVEAARALSREGPTGVLLPGPVALAGTVAGDALPASPDRDWEDLVDACAIALCDVVGPLSDAGAHVVLEEPRAPGEDVLALTSSLWNVLRHRRRPCLAIVLDGGPGALAGCDAVAGVAHGPGVPVWDDMTPLPAGQPDVLSPQLAAGVSPERVQSLVRDLRAAA